eukprot:PhM_4_TR17786/c0_g1_i1/m.103790
MRRFAGRASMPALAVCVRCHGAPAAAAGGKKYDLFGYEVNTNTAPWIEKIKKVQHYDEAGDIMVQMNVANTPPDLVTYNATLQKIFECKSKQEESIPNESKLCAMLDLIEEMQLRNSIKPDATSWTWVMRECVSAANFRIGYVIESIMTKDCGGCPADLVAANEANASKAKSEGREHPAVLSKQTALFDSVDKTH